MKKKNATRFPLSRKGYDRAAVGYIALEQAKADEIQLGQRDRVNELKQENESLKLQIEVLRGREEQIKLALVNATENANRLTEDVKARYRQELERLRLFRAKWLGVYEQMKERYHFDKDALNVESVAVSVEIELKKFLAQDFSLNNNATKDVMEEHFRKEAQRLTNQQLAIQNSPVQDSKNSEDLKTLLKDVETKKKTKSTAAFSVDDALNPTQSLKENFDAVKF